MSQSFQKNLTDARMARILAAMKPLSDLLKEWREASKLTPSEAARRCNLSPQMWWELESGSTATPRKVTMRKLVDGTGIPLEFLAVASYFDPAEAVPA
jgi:transcriptional regulator with XRE-family HTH domain